MRDARPQEQTLNGLFVQDALKDKTILSNRILQVGSPVHGLKSYSRLSNARLRLQGVRRARAIPSPVVLRPYSLRFAFATGMRGQNCHPLLSLDFSKPDISSHLARLMTVLRFDFGENTRDVVSYCLHAQLQPTGNHDVWATLCKKFKNLLLA
jgi:hypothetical protein